jgi:hypothetical protein
VLSDLLSLIEKIPAALWGVFGAVIGSVIALGGVVLTNRASDRRLRIQLGHDRELKARDRELALRKDVYLAAAEAVSAGFYSVARFADLSIPHGQLTQQYLEKAPAIAKVHVVAKEQTARAFLHFVGELSAAFLRLFTKRYPLIAQQQRLAMLQDHMNRFGAERDHIVQLMKQYNLDGVPDPRRWEVLQRNFDFERDRVDKVIKEHTALAAEHYANALEYMKECIAEMMKLANVLVPTIVAVRDELDLPIDEATYRQLVDESIAKQQTALDEFLKNVPHQVDA